MIARTPNPKRPWSLDTATLLGGVESLCDHIGTLTESMLDQARESGLALAHRNARRRRR